MPSPPNLEGQGINILSSLLQVIIPVMDGMNAISITFLFVEVVLILPWWHAYSTLRYEEILRQKHKSFTYSNALEARYSSLYLSDPSEAEAPKWSFLMVFIFYLDTSSTNDLHCFVVSVNYDCHS